IEEGSPQAILAALQAVLSATATAVKRNQRSRKDAAVHLGGLGCLIGVLMTLFLAGLMTLAQRHLNLTGTEADPTTPGLTSGYVLVGMVGIGALAAGLYVAMGKRLAGGFGVSHPDHVKVASALRLVEALGQLFPSPATMAIRLDMQHYSHGGSSTLVAQEPVEGWSQPVRRFQQRISHPWLELDVTGPSTVALRIERRVHREDTPTRVLRDDDGRDEVERRVSDWIVDLIHIECAGLQAPRTLSLPGGATEWQTAWKCRYRGEEGGAEVTSDGDGRLDVRTPGTRLEFNYVQPFNQPLDQPFGPTAEEYAWSNDMLSTVLSLQQTADAVLAVLRSLPTPAPAESSSTPRSRDH
ncbi:MAG TPA: hypothetical protein VGO93_02260, partial [Candidatus Xenobia bacterium]